MEEKQILDKVESVQKNVPTSGQIKILYTLKQDKN